jgi:hypothetical protein
MGENECFYFISGSKVAFSRFADGQGNKHNDGFFFANGGTEGRWHDYHCESIIGHIGYHYAYICEFVRIYYLYCCL